jgi:hypothetical protein
LDIAERHPGELLKSGLREMQKYLNASPGADPSTWANGVVLAYVTRVLFQQHPIESMGPRNAQELRTLAESLDALLCGGLVKTADRLMQRLKAIEQSLSDGHWHAAQHMEAIPPPRASATSARERELATRAELRAGALREQLAKVKVH